jgi:soluble lytic murein transglycosylase
VPATPTPYRYGVRSDGSIRISRGSIAGRVALGLLLTVALLGCDTTERQRVERLLDERAPALDAPTRRTIARAVVEAGRTHDIDPLLLLAVIEVESTYRPDAHSRRGAVGLMQVRPQTAREIAEGLGHDRSSTEDLLRPEHNVALGAAYLAELKRRFATWPAALTAYNRGPRRVRRLETRSPEVTSGYARRVLRLHATLIESVDASP